MEHGDLITLDEALSFLDGRKRQFFKVLVEKPACAKRSSKVFLCVETGDRCRISGIMKRGWAKIDPSKLHWVVEQFTLCDGFTNTWTIEDVIGESRPLTFETKKAAEDELADFASDIKAEIEAGERDEDAGYETSEFRIVPMLGETILAMGVL